MSTKRPSAAPGQPGCPHLPLAHGEPMGAGRDGGLGFSSAGSSARCRPGSPAPCTGREAAPMAVTQIRSRLPAPPAGSTAACLLPSLSPHPRSRGQDVKRGAAPRNTSRSACSERRPGFLPSWKERFHFSSPPFRTSSATEFSAATSPASALPPTPPPGSAFRDPRGHCPFPDASRA